MFLHRFQQCGLRLRRRAIDFVCQNHVGEQWAFDEDEFFCPIRLIFDDFRAGDVARHQVGGELDSLEAEVEYFRQSPDHQCLCQARHSYHQAVSPGKDSHEKLFQNFFLADDDLRHFVSDTLCLFYQ